MAICLPPHAIVKRDAREDADFALAHGLLNVWAGVTNPMQPIDTHDLENVRGGFLGALLGAAPGILQGVSGIIAASKAGKGGGGGPPPGGPGGPPPGGPGGETAAAAQGAVSGGIPSGGGGGCGCSVSISINGVQQSR